ncbi:MAG: PAS domain-containing sensor histidine kinase [Alphaproteobacteria bacterium]|jgi:two-component system, NtrC family, nitrogen regulation sensor histidine kinase NtrY|nr:PAS domain-containing sensor histidine kinase [Alphaproteobacteria bacterium]MBT4019674.1 PAS domain-containing sensor histidine kinase [Alphaproteobacteria bacterium]MBT4967057.1 PAS domain-containing sensor histidine kinase [Alphaproteobacteria bacterium]MBT5161825.1 PAS domain-containing sensor histidine kinase [Alphaproteobacteria bacterium]
MTVDTGTSHNVLFTQLLDWARRINLARKLAYMLAIAAIIAGIATYGALTQTSQTSGADQSNILTLLIIDGVILLGMGVLVATNLVNLWMARRRGAAGSRLHTRMVLIFSLLAVAPAIVVGVFSALFLNFGIEAWFQPRIQTALNSSIAVAAAYTREHRRGIEADALGMAAVINRLAPQLVNNPRNLTTVITVQADTRSLTEAVVVDGSRRIIARTPLAFTIMNEGVPRKALEQAANGEVVILTNDDDDRLRALVRLNGLNNAFLYVGRFIDPQVLGHKQKLQQATDDYRRMEGDRSRIQITQALIFLVVAVLLLLTAIWFALNFAGRLVGPVTSLVGAAERVRDGDLAVRVPEGPVDDEVGMLSRAFNRMTDQLEAQRHELMQANQTVDDRRRFTEAVLSGVTAGVIGLDSEARINLPNRSALELLETSMEDIIGEPLSAVAPEMKELLGEAQNRASRRAEGQINLVRKGRTHILLVRIVGDRSGEQGIVVTFDDITELVAAQRTSAWADIARRIAHEIKNPLTPIQLSAERLKRKYLKEVTSDPEVFTNCTDTIIRQVGDIGRMVDEFSAFARMPSPKFETEKLDELVQEAVFMQQVAHPEVSYDSKLPDVGVYLSCDRRQVAQALTNLLQNAADALTEAHNTDGKIEIVVVEEDGETIVEVIDNGPGFPGQDQHRLTEPYVTHRDKGTGLGLAIVKKVMEDHGGRLVLAQPEQGGASVKLVFNSGASLQSAKREETKRDLKEEKIANHG